MGDTMTEDTEYSIFKSSGESWLADTIIRNFVYIGTNSASSNLHQYCKLELTLLAPNIFYRFRL